MEPFDLWGQGRGAYIELDAPNDREAVRRLADRSAPARGRFRPEALLHRVGGRIRAEVDGVTVGWMPAETAEPYLPTLASLARRGLVARVMAYVDVYSYEDYPDYGSDRERTVTEVSTYLSLAAPHLLVPLNTAPAGDIVTVPVGRKVAVTATEEGGPGALEPWIRPEGACWVYCTLHPLVVQLARSTRETVEVKVDGRSVGTLSAVVSKKLLPLVHRIRESGRMTVARGLVEGNIVHTQMRVAVLKASEVSAQWLHDNSLDVPTPTTARSDTADLSRTQTSGAGATPSAGFYPDPDGIADERYWDGQAWTSRIRMGRR